MAVFGAVRSLKWHYAVSEVQTMKVARRLIELLASLRLAVVTMGLLAMVCVAATIHESRFGTPSAQHFFYGTAWFAAVLGLLAANVLLSMVRRWPWKAEHAGFVLAHVGILALLAGSVITSRFGLDGSMTLVENGEAAAQVRLPQRSLHVVLDDGARLAIPVSHADQWWGEERHALPGGLDLVITRHQPHVASHEHLKAATDGGVPAIKYHFEGEFGREEGWLLAGDPDHGEAGFGPVVLSLAAADGSRSARELLAVPSGRPQARFVADTDGVLRYALASRKAATVRGLAAVGQPIRTPWMDLALVVDEFLPKAGIGRHLLPQAPPDDASARVPAMEVKVERGGRPGSAEWIAWGNERRLEAPGGSGATVRFDDAASPLPFRVALLDFESKKYPGTSMAATYQSLLRVDDPERGRSEHVVAMNRPLHYRGYTFFQSSYAEGERMTSVLSVSRAPGLPLVYLGTTLLTVGIAWMFYGKPWLARRRGARALAALRSRGDLVPSAAGAR
jgi:ResB-like family protein